MIKGVNSWRGLMAVAVVLFHCNVACIYNVAVSGVTFFFLSSALLLAMRHPFERLSVKRYYNFVVDHAMRLYPLHWLGLALLVIIALTLHAGHIDWGATALSALLLHAWSPVHDVHYGLNPVAWYLSALLFCYCIYPLVICWLGRWRLRHKALLALVLAAALGAVMLPLDIPGREAVFVNPLSHVVDLVTGITLCHLCLVLRDRWPRVGFGAATLIEVGVLVLLAAVIALNMSTTLVRPWEDDVLWLLPQGAVLTALVWLNGQPGAIGRVLLCRPLQWLGSISFEVFVLQFVAFRLFGFVIAPAAGHLGWDIYHDYAWMVLAVLLPLSWLVNRFFTRPLRRFLNTGFSNSQLLGTTNNSQSTTNI